MSPGRTVSASCAAFAASVALVDARAPPSPSGPPSPGDPCRLLWMRLVTRKNSRVAADHHPARVDPGAAGVGQQRLEELDHAAAAGGRVDVPDRASAEDDRRPCDRLRDGRIPVAQELAKALRRQGVDRLLAGPGRHHATAGWADPRRRRRPISGKTRADTIAAPTRLAEVEERIWPSWTAIVVIATTRGSSVAE